MFDQRIRTFSEALARNIDRRTFLRRTGSTIASGMAALAVGSVLSTGSARAGSKELIPSEPQCGPPGPYCNIGTGALSGCHGGHCFQHVSGGNLLTCRVYYAFYTTGCWTSAQGGGYWTCCDCECFNTQGV